MAVAHPQVTPDEFARLMADRGWDAPLEHLDGEVVMAPPGGGAHGLTAGLIGRALWTWQQRVGDGGLVLLDTFVLMGDDTLAPDLAYWSAGRRPPIGAGRIDGPVPDLVVEIASSSTAANDLGPKRAAYAGSGVGEQWLLDPRDATALVVDARGVATRLVGHELLASAVLDGFSVPVDQMFGDA